MSMARQSVVNAVMPIASQRILNPSQPSPAPSYLSSWLLFDLALVGLDIVTVANVLLEGGLVLLQRQWMLEGDSQRSQHKIQDLTASFETSQRLRNHVVLGKGT